MKFSRTRLALAMAAADGGADPIRPVMMLRPVALTTEYELIVYGDIGESWWGDSITALSVVQQLQALDASVTQINVRMNSYGGSVSDGLAIYNALRRHPARKEGTVDGVAMSSGSLILMACDTIKMPATAVLMIHAPWGAASGNANDMRSMADVLDKYADAMANAYARKSGHPKAEMQTLLADGQDHYYTGEQAVDAGFADALIEDVRQSEDGDAAAQGAARAAGVARFTDSAPAHIRQAALAAVRQQPLALPDTPKPRMRVPAGFDLGHLEQALGTPEGQQALLGALTTAVSADSGDTDMKRRNLYAALFRAPAGADGGDLGGGGNPAPPAGSNTAETVLAQIRQRNADIRAALEPHMARDGVQAILTDALCDPSHTVDSVRARVLDLIGAAAKPVGNVRIENGPDESDKFRAAGENAILARVNMAKADGQNPLRGMTMREIARAAVERNGRSTAGMDVREIVAAAFTTTSDFPALLTNTSRAALLRGYDEAEETFPLFTRPGTLTDFRESSRTGLGHFSSLGKVAEGGEYKYGKFGAQGNSIILATYGSLFAISRQAIINDDLGAFTDVPAKMGRAAKRTIGDLVFAVLTNNPRMADGKNLFGADHANLITPGGGITTDSVDEISTLMGTQKVDGRPVTIPLKYLLVPIALKSQANLVRSNVTKVGGSDNSTQANVMRDQFEVIADSRLDAASKKAWYAAADAIQNDTIEVAYLDGVQQPFLDQKDGWSVDGTEFKVRIDAGVAPTDYRGLAKNAGG